MSGSGFRLYLPSRYHEPRRVRVAADLPAEGRPTRENAVMTTHDVGAVKIHDMWTNAKR